jgi:regulator of replication initiation timing
LHDFLVWVWNWIGNPLGGGAIGTILGAVSSIFALRKELRKRERLNEHLDDALKAALEENKILKYESDRMKRQLAETALNEAQQLLKDDSYIAGHHVLAEWLSREGKHISDVLLLQAEWADAHAAADFRASGLVAAEAFATAALCFWPANRAARRLLEDVVALRALEAQLSPSLEQSLNALEEQPAESLFDAELVEGQTQQKQKQGFASNMVTIMQHYRRLNGR